MNKKIVFFGNERLATGVTTSAPTLLALIDAGYEICAVVSNYERGQSRNARELEIKKIAEANNIPVLLPGKPLDIIDQLRAYNAEIAVLVAYGKIVPQEIIDLFPSGIINIHPSLLPMHRGPTPIESVILSGNNRTGVSVMELVKAMDAGPVFGYSEIELTGKESKQELADELLSIGSSMVIELLPGIIDKSVVTQPQEESLATYDSLISKNSGKLDFNKSAEQLEREVRAYKDWPKSTAQLASIDVIITKAKVLNNRLDIGKVFVKDGHLIIGCGQKSLEVLCLKPVGKKEMPANSFIAGYKNKI